MREPLEQNSLAYGIRACQQHNDNTDTRLGKSAAALMLFSYAMRIFLITGIAGSGKSVALNVLEDAGYYCVDNLPAKFLPELAQFLQKEGSTRLAVAIDARSGGSIAQLPNLLATLRAQYDVRVLFLTADTDTLVQRFSETRRRHPLSIRPDASNPANAPFSNSLIEAIERERELVSPLAELALQIDTSHVRAGTLRAWVEELIRHEQSGLTLMFESFGFKHGVPRDADLVFDVRALPNPYYDLNLRPLTGLDPPVAAYLLSQPMVLAMADDIRAYIEKWLPSFASDNRSYLTVAIGCTGGQHRSVFISERLAAYFRGYREVIVRHRELSARS